MSGARTRRRPDGASLPSPKCGGRFLGGTQAGPQKPDKIPDRRCIYRPPRPWGGTWGPLAPCDARHNRQPAASNRNRNRRPVARADEGGARERNGPHPPVHTGHGGAGGGVLVVGWPGPVLNGWRVLCVRCVLGGVGGISNGGVDILGCARHIGGT